MCAFVLTSIALGSVRTARAIPTNLATGGTATASSFFGDNAQFAPEQAINGNRAGDDNDIWHSKGDANDPDWWQVDLGADYYLDRIQILPRQLSQGTVGNFTIDVFSSTDPVTPVFSQVFLPTTATDRDNEDTFFPGPSAWGTTAVRNLQGRTIRITRNDATPDAMTFAEVEVYGQATPNPLENLALNRPVTATQPHPAAGTSPAWSNDGNIDGQWWHYTVYHSDPEVTPFLGHFWQVELAGPSTIDYLNLYARGDFPGNSGEVRVSVLGEDGTTVIDSVNVLLSEVDLGAFRYDFTHDFASNPIGKYVRIETLDENILNFAELEVFGTPTTTTQAGDFDGDGDVDGADFVAWQTNFPTASGATLADGDADSDGDVDGADFVVWQTNFPTTPGGAASPVPEPLSGLLMLLGAAMARGLFRDRKEIGT